MSNENRDKLHEAEIEILKYFIDVCEQNEFSYFMMGGSLLGTIRHKGFIPWDDDVDVGMPRDDYEKLLELLSKNENTKFPFKNFNNSDIKTYFSRIENPKVKIEDDSANKKDIRNSWIDIFPLDGMPNNNVIKNIHKFRLLANRVLLQYSQFDEIVNVSLTERPWYERFLIKLGSVIKPQRFLNTRKQMLALDKKLKKYDYDTSEYVVNFMGAYKFKEMFPRSYYANLELFNFEDIKVKCSKNYDSILKQMYGESYMMPPSEMIKNKHFSKTIE